MTDYQAVEKFFSDKAISKRKFGLLQVELQDDDSAVPSNLLLHLSARAEIWFVQHVGSANKCLDASTDVHVQVLSAVWEVEVRTSIIDARIIALHNLIVNLAEIAILWMYRMVLAIELTSCMTEYRDTSFIEGYLQLT